jgi:hypothetical protein
MGIRHVVQDSGSEGMGVTASQLDKFRNVIICMHGTEIRSVDRVIVEDFEVKCTRIDVITYRHF